ncbi:SHC SH2 domain-binding protein 1 [Rhinichthys klamathensis goyatoka]|uniref:SHC SH2 domain-binding protein 1 n=1 Tax=Rhinichthys klamathensis goyatoka TaxID=3034132 RepID=UPI0024B59B46|nr:SHC SH2 domain-binding protein 1 [Rhinichthys klamathensis goyatoka]
MSEELECSKPEEVRDAETENSVEIIIKLTSENPLNDHDHNVNQETERDTETLCTEITPNHNRVSKELFQTEEEDDDDDSGTHYLSCDERPCTHLRRAERPGHGKLLDTFQTDHLLYYERFKAYQDYMLGDCKTSEVKAFTAEYLEKIVEPCDWQAIWHTDVFDVLVEVVDVDCKELKAKVELVLPMECETRSCDLTEESMKSLLEATLHKVPLLELSVVYDESGDFDQTALALEHLRFFYKHIWRKWDEEDEDDDFDYFVRCVEPRLRLYYDILEDRVPAGLVAEYHSVLALCSGKFQEFSSLRSDLNSDSESEQDNVSMVEGLRMYEQLEALKRKLRIIENPLLRYVLGYKVNSGQQSCRAKGPHPAGGHVVHLVSASATVHQLQSLITDKLMPHYSSEEFEVQFHSDPVLAVNACYEGDVVIICPGLYIITSSISLVDSIVVEGYGLPDEVVIEKRNKGDSFVESTGANVKLSNLKFIQRDAIEGILCVRQGKLEMENCVMQCETTGVIVRSAAQLSMNMCDLYGSKGAGVEIYPGSVCSLVGNGIHHCKEGILIKDFADELDAMPKITMVNNVIHNNQGYGVILVKPGDAAVEDLPPEPNAADEKEEESEDTGVKPEADMDEDDDCDVPIIVVEEECPAIKHSHCIPPDFTEGNDAIKQELVATSAKKHGLQKSRIKALGAMQADENLLSQEMFISIHGNQFKLNGKGSFGTFLY